MTVDTVALAIADLKACLGLDHDEELLKVEREFDSTYYLECNEDVKLGSLEAFSHFAKYGMGEGRRPTEAFDTAFYIRQYGNQLKPGLNPFAHYVLEGLRSGFSQSLDAFTTLHVEETIIAKVGAELDAAFYLSFNPDVDDSGMSPVLHYCRFGWKEGRDPLPTFSTNFYLNQYPEVRELDVPPLYHYLIHGKAFDYATSASSILWSQTTRQNGDDTDFFPSLPSGIDLFTYEVIKSEFDENFYRQKNAIPDSVGDLVLHFMTTGVAERLNPSPGFNTDYYLKANPDVAAQEINPFFHFIVQGRSEGRVGLPVSSIKDLSAHSIAHEHEIFANRGPDFEEFDERIRILNQPAAKALAFYLPQFHAIPENDFWWGQGFTEWRNVARGIPRFKGHYQPRIPRDLGFYDLSDRTTLRRQVELAKKAGIFGFAFYYYNFNGKRLLELPLDHLLDSDIDMPFLIVWANENWARTWDGGHRDILISQDYHLEDEAAFLADLARHFRDVRYITIQGRPLFVIYRPGSIPDTRATIERWRSSLLADHGMQPLIFMSQGFDENDPSLFGLDGAIEFPPHKVAAGLPAINSRLEILDPKFGGHVMEYKEVIKRSLADPDPPFHLIKGVTLGWDNDARRPGNGMVLHGATPELYEMWLRALVEKSRDNPVEGESFVVINAWNEWAEAAYLEPDVYFGSAYLNATARAVCLAAKRPTAATSKLVLVGHDGHPHGAQLLLLNICRVLKQRYNIEIAILICGGGPLVQEYARLAPTTKVDLSDLSACSSLVRDLKDQGFQFVLTNTVVVGPLVRLFADRGMPVVSLVHELPNFIQERGLAGAARAISNNAKKVVFASEFVKTEFGRLTELPDAKAIVRPQGIYAAPGKPTSDRFRLRDELGIGQDRIVVLNVGYADDRKGFDLFVRTAELAASKDPKVLFLWAGAATRELMQWRVPEIASGPLAQNFTFCGFQNDVGKYYRIADIFFLSSREDPYPSVILEAMQRGLPVVAFEGATGAAELIKTHGALADRRDLQGAADHLLTFARLPLRERRSRAVARCRAMKADFQFDDYCFDLLRMHHKDLVKISVIVPNYNYAKYLSGRLVSIFDQTYPVFEIIFLDDCSTDDSLALANDLARQHDRHIRIIPNKQNSGSAFKQWQRGAREARGDLVWIAEADDVSDVNFLDCLVSTLLREEADLAFSDSWQIDAAGNKIGDSYKAYMNRTLGGAFDRSFADVGIQVLERHLSIMNVILNVSAVVWRKDRLLDALNGVGDELFSYKVAGDWRLYVELCLGNGRVAYESRPLNGHRRHDISITKALDKTRHYREICKMQSLVRRKIPLSEHSKRRSKEFLHSVRQVLAV